MSDHEALVAVLAQLSFLGKLCLWVLALQVISLVLSFGKLLMMNYVRTELQNATQESVQYRTLTQQYYDLYTREGREVGKQVLDAAKMVQETVKHPSDSGPQTTVEGTPEQWKKARERRDRKPPFNPVDTP